MQKNSVQRYSAEEDAVLIAEKEFGPSQFFAWRKVVFILTLSNAMYRREVYRPRVALGMSGKIVNTGWQRRGSLKRDVTAFVRYFEESGFTVRKGPRFLEEAPDPSQEKTA